MADTLSLDTTLIQSWRSDDAYDYERELARSGKSAWDRLIEALNHFLSDRLGLGNVDIDPTAALVILSVIIVVLLVVLILVKKPALFYGDKSMGSYAVEDDNIYGVDFASATAKAVAAGQWRQAARLTYLSILRRLSDRNLVSWHISKSPTQFAAEFDNPAFRRMTNLFLRLRYGGYAATEADYRQMEQLAAEVSQSIA